MADFKLSMEEIKQLMDQLASTDLGKLEIREGDFSITLSAKEAGGVPAAPVMEPVSVEQPLRKKPSERKTDGGNIVKAPIVGTFYASPSPDKPPYVTVGSQVKKGDTLFVIESMKLMNEIQSEFDGEVSEILVENAQGVEFNQPILVIK